MKSFAMADQTRELGRYFDRKPGDVCAGTVVRRDRD